MEISAENRGDWGQCSGLLIANRGEVAVRIARAAAELGIRTCAVYSEDDDDSLHRWLVDEARPLRGRGVSAYLDSEQLLDAAREAGCDAIHPGYGFLSESIEFARRCKEEDLKFVGPTSKTLGLFGDKASARRLAVQHDVPVAVATSAPVTVDEAREFWASLGSGSTVMVKAVAGGGGRGMKVMHSPEQLEEAMERCRSEALSAFGNGDLYVEEVVSPARHVEVQIIGDGTGTVSHLGTRDCSVQRRHQKLIEIAPAPELTSDMRDALTAAAVRLGEAVAYRSLGTVEFLVDAGGGFVFMEANPRLQVEHTVTEEVLGVDLVAAQLRLALGARLNDVALAQADVPTARGFAIQARVNTERLLFDGTTRPMGGKLLAFEPPGGPGVRTDTCAYAGYRTNPAFDSLLAKVIVHSTAGTFEAAADKAHRALRELRAEGVETNTQLLREVLRHPDFREVRLDVRFADDRIEELLSASKTTDEPPWGQTPADGGVGKDPVRTERKVMEVHEGAFVTEAPMPGTILNILVEEGNAVRAGETVIVISAMKMEHELAATVTGVVQGVPVAPGDTVYAGDPLMVVREEEVELSDGEEDVGVDLDAIRPDLAEVMYRQGITRDEARPEAVARHHRKDRRTARENLDDLCDDSSFTEYGSLAIAAQRQRRAFDDLVQNTPADGFVGGTAHINGDQFDDDRSRCAVMSYDYTVLAGTQGYQGHRKKDRLFELAERLRLPVVFFAEGGGGRPGDTDAPMISGLDTEAFARFAQLSGLVPMVGVVSGRCFAGNAALLGCCDVIIATEDATIGMAGPAMIEGGGLGSYTPEEVGPVSVQTVNGVVDVAVTDEAEAVQTAKRYLSYFQGPVGGWSCSDQRILRTLIPENRTRVYDIRRVVEHLSDTDSVLELRRSWAPGMITSLIRMEGRPVGVIANNPAHLGGAIDSEGADKAARFMQLCDAHDLPLLFLCDTPGFMVGPEAERTAQVRHFSRMFVTGASLSVPFFTVVVRKGYGLGAQSMAGGSFREPLFTVAWPTGEIGAMGLEGAVQLGYRKELDAVENPEDRKALYDRLVSEAYEHGKALNAASSFELDDVIDPADTRARIVGTLRVTPPLQSREGKKRPCVDTW